MTPGDDSQKAFDRASAWRRIAAFGIDYTVVIVPYMGLLGLAGWALISLGITPFSPHHPWSNQGIAVFFLTLPIASYFAISEASASQATLGKRAMRIVVVNSVGNRASLKQSFVRVIVKFLPWEYFHTILWHWDGWPINPSLPTTLQLTAMTIGWVAMGGYFVSLFIGGGRTPYDWVAGTMVTNRTDLMPNGI